MCITDITPQKRNDKFFNVFIDCEFAFSLSQVDILYYHLETGKEISRERYDFILHNSIFSKAKDKAFHYIGFKARTEKEVRDKLLQEFNPDVTEDVIVLLKRYSYINDEEYAHKYLRDKSSLNLMGKRRIFFELKKRGISDSIIEKLSEGYACDETEAIKKLIEKKSRNKDLTDAKTRSRIFNFLVNKGYEFEDIKKAMDNFI